MLFFTDVIGRVCVPLRLHNFGQQIDLIVLKNELLHDRDHVAFPAATSTHWWP